MSSLLIKNIRAVDAKNDFTTDVLIVDGKIAEVYAFNIVVHGDLADVGRTTTYDAVLILKHCSGQHIIDVSNKYYGDLDLTGDNLINTADAVYILRRCAGL